MSRPAGQALTFVIFGATGDLAVQKLWPALFRLSAGGHLPPDCRFLGVSRTPHGDEGFRLQVRRLLAQERARAGEDFDRWCDQCVFYHALSANGGDGYNHLAQRIAELEGEGSSSSNRLFYLAVPPRSFPAIIEGLGRAGLHQSGGWTRLVVEKPFGEDLDSARALNALTHRYFDESQVFRIDHYLGKETVQNLLVFRFGNAIFESLWNRSHIESVQITVAETVGVGSRAGYYDGVGALRDMVQNHLSQILSLVAMEPPVHFEAEDVRNEKVKVVHSLAPIRPEDVVLGQYGRGRVGGEEVPAYREEGGVPRDSRTATFAALKVYVANWRWHGVPFYLRTGKRMAQRQSQIVVLFRQPPVTLFESANRNPLRSNALVITLQPDEGFDLHFHVKVPGTPLRLEDEQLAFRYAEAFPGRMPDAYETLLLEVLRGDQSLFVRADWIETSWKLYTPLLRSSLPVHEYAAGGWGPPEAERLLPAGDSWWNAGPVRHELGAGTPDLR